MNIRRHPVRSNIVVGADGVRVGANQIPRRALAGAAVLAWASLASGCELFAGPEIEAQCPAGGVLVTAAAFDAGEPVRGDLEVRGTASHEGGLAVRRVTVAGVEATSITGSFATWSAIVPHATLLQLRDGDDGKATLPISAEDACGLVSKAAGMLVAVRDVVITELGITIDSPADGFLPTTLAVPALVTVRAGASGVGASVSLTASSGGFITAGEGEPASAVTVVLDAAGFNDAGDATGATADVLLVVDTAGDVRVTASADGVDAEASIVASGPPSFAPFTATLSPGEELGVLALSRASSLFCRAAADDPIEVVPLGAFEQELVDADANGAIELQVRAHEVAGGEEAIVTCHDAYGQSATATYTAAP